MRAPGQFLPMVRGAARVLSTVTTPTPVITCSTASRIGGCDAVFKLETMQRTGSFKFRGAYTALSRLLTPDCGTTGCVRHEGSGGLPGGVVCHSSGNHGQAVAAAAELLGVRATVVVPADCPGVKQEAIAGYGAELLLCEPTQQGRNDAVAAVVADTGAVPIPPYNDVDVMSGQGTIALELLEQAGPLDAIVVPTSGGGMIGGIALATKALKRNIRVYAVEPNGKRLAEALAADERVPFPETANALLPTIADAIRTQPIGDVPWPAVKEWVEPTVFTVTDDQIREAMRFAFERIKTVIEPAAATGLAALLDGQILAAESGAVTGRPPRVGIVLCGGNVDLSNGLPWVAS